MTDAERKHVLRDIYDQVALSELAHGRLTSEVLVEALDRTNLQWPWTEGVDVEGVVSQLNLMLEAARDPREAAVDAKLAEFREGGK